MADNFNLRQFLSENKLTKNAKLINEGLVVNGKEVDYTSIETDGDYPSDVYIVAANFEDGTSLSEEELQQLENEHSDLAAEIEFEKQSSGLDHDEDYGVDETKEETTEEGYTPKSKLEQVIQQAWAEKDLEKAKQLVVDLIEPSKVKSKDIILQTIKGIGNKMKLDQYLANSLLKFEKLGLDESKLTAKERRLVEMVNNAMGLEEENVDYTMGNQNDPNQLSNPAPELNIPEGDESVEESKPLPTYESVEDLMKEIEHGTNKAMYEYKISEMKRIAKQLEEKVSTLEESEHAAHINPADVKKMKKDILTLHKGVAKIEKEYDRKFNKKTKTSEPKEEKESVTLAEGFDLKKFLVENKLTTASQLETEEDDK